MSLKLLEDTGGLGHFLGEKDTRLLQPTSLKEQREFPGIGLLESIRSLIQKWFYKCRTKWSFQCMELSIYAEDMIREALRESLLMNVSCLIFE